MSLARFGRKSIERDDINGKPSTFDPSAHDIEGATHTLASSVAGYFMRALGATSFGFQAIQAGDLPTNLGAHTIGDGGTTNYMAVTAAGLTYWTGTGGRPFASLLVADNAVETAIAEAGTLVQVTVFDTNGPYLDAVPDHTNDHITITKAGHYRVAFRACAETVAADPDVFRLIVQKNNGATAFNSLCAMQKMAGIGGADYTEFFASDIIDLAAADTIELWATNEDDTSNILLSNIAMTVEMVAGT
jgi:hypothetical protein